MSEQPTWAQIVETVEVAYSKLEQALHTLSWASATGRAMLDEEATRNDHPAQES